MVIGCFLLLSSSLNAQDSSKNKIHSLVNFFKKTNYVVAPIISYQPVTSWQFGVGVKYLYRPKNYDTAHTRISYIAAAAQYTLNNQILISPYFVHFFNKEKYMLDGNYSYKKFPQNYYGIGNETSTANQEIVDQSEVKAEQILFRKVKGQLFAGVGFRFFSAFDVSQVNDGLLIETKPVGWNGFTSFGPSINIRYDSRDNILNPAEGEYADISLERMSKAAAALTPYTLFKFDTRKYIKPFGEKNGILASQVFLYSVLNGDAPFSELAFVGHDMIMRGYYERRFIDKHFIGGQAEYRYPLPRNFGLIAFAGLGDVANSYNNFQLNSLKYSIGAGIRYKIIPKENINVRFDVGFGRGSNSFYINISEAF